MKRLKFLILALGLFTAHVAFAVTLPTTSYTEYYSSSDNVSGSVSIYGSGSVIEGSFQQLGDAAEKCPGDGNGKTTADPPEFCSDCCAREYPAPQYEAREQCVYACMRGPAVPLDGGLAVFFLLSLIGGIHNILFRTKKK
ncbi:MAG: hypothetical protein IJR06_03575 [Paludibacteraceae bacterium]|nr:hypothetical protein [Paludibacteraceae bacterium]